MAVQPPADRNVISGNNSDGVELSSTGSGDNLVLGNYLGTDSSGTVRRGNNGAGVYVNGAPNTTIGGLASGEANLLSGNRYGIEINGVNATNTVILGNIIGADLGGVASLNNSGSGVYVTGNARFNVIGATNNGAGNRIAFNTGDGVTLQSGTNNSVRGNSISSNAGLGIDIEDNGVTANDPGDADSGSNFRQNYPVITNAVLGVGSTVIQGTLNSRPDSVYVLDFYASLAPDTGGDTEGGFYLGTTTVATGSDSNATFSVNLPLTDTGGHWITATATDTNANTSEFSAGYSAISLLPPQTFTVINTNDSGPGSLRQAILDNNVTFNSTANTIAFSIPGAGPHVIGVSSELPAITAPAIVDGYSQPGASPNTLANDDNAVLKIRLDAAEANLTCLRLAAAGSVVRGLSITRFGYSGVELDAPGRSAVEGCFFGLDTDGSTTFSVIYGEATKSMVRRETASAERTPRSETCSAA